MSAEEFIYSVVNSDNVAQLDLNVIANTLASVDSLIRQIKSQQVENENLKEKISSLRSSALQIKQLYEAEVGKNQGTVNREEDYIRQLRVLEGRASAAENARVNAELREKETVAELERKLESSKERYDALAVDMVKSCSLLADNGLLPTEQQLRFRDVKSHVQGIIQNGQEVPEDIVAYLSRKKPSRKKRKSECELRDQAAITIGQSSCSVGVNTISELPSQTTSSTSTHDLVTVFPNCLMSDEPKPLPALPKRTVVDKSTMYSSSTITRSTCTSAFIKKVDVGINFPEVIPKSIDDILRECVIELPSLLSPILDDIPIRKESVHTQTESWQDQIPTKTQMASCGTNTNLRNIRRKIDYVRKFEQLPANQLLSSIKKEEMISPAGSIQNIPAVFHQSDELTGVNPQLTQIWGLLGDTMFRLLGSGRMFDSQCYNTINERMAMINNLIDPETRRGTEMMSEVFAAAAASAAMASSECEEDSGKPVAGRRADSSVVRLSMGRGKCMDDYEADAAGMDDAEERDEPELCETLSLETIAFPCAGMAESQSNGPPDVDSCRLEREAVTGSTDEISSACEVAPSGGADKSTTLPTVPENSGAVTATEAKETLVVTSESTEVITDPDCPLADELPSSSQEDPHIFSLIQHTEESNDFAALIASSDELPTPVEYNESGNPTLEEHDEIAQELRLMEEGNTHRGETLPATFSFGALDKTSEKYYMQVVGDEDVASGTDDESDQMLIADNSPSRSLQSSSCTSIGSNGTLISPIKVKETNDLVKDQFKTPTSPAISKRKLRERLEGGSPVKRGRLSPTTETLLEDDWDRKLLHIKDYFMLPLSLNPIEDAERHIDARDDEDNEDCDTDDNEEDDPVQNLPDCLATERFDVTYKDDQESKRPNEELTKPIRVDVGVVSSNEIIDSPQSPVPASPVSSPRYDSFKEPLRIDTVNTTTSTATDSPESPIPGDSPMSPVPDTQSSSSWSCEDSPMSPPLESRISMYNETVEPKIIPLEHPIANRLEDDCSNTPIGKTIARYSTSRRAEVLRRMAPDASKKEAALIRKVVQLIKAYVQGEWTMDGVTHRCTELMQVTKDTRIISQAFIDSVVSYGDMPVDVQCSPPAPPLPRIVQQLVLLLKTMNESLLSLDRVILQEIDRKVFTLKSDKVNLVSITAMTHLYIGITDCNRFLGGTGRLYIYKCLYYFNFKGLPLIYYILKAFPHALPKKGSLHYDNSDAVVSTIRTVLMNTNFLERPNSAGAHLYKKSELLKLLKYFYGYQQGSPTYEELIINLVEKIKANKLRNVDYCLILVAKRKGYAWANTHIVQKHLYPLLNDYLKQLNAEGTVDDQICCLIFTLSAILKTQPNGQNVSGIMQILGSIVQMSDSNRRVQEAAVAALMRMTRFGFADIYEWLCKWCPTYEVSGRIKLMMATFVHRKDGRFWQQLNQREIV
ncbi:uncharacterized protein LOC131686704 [Topomyia yanbarensis]|uniref:uncharacterized protein LOC131686704 n=1 Tax=Topomyia yanbarensis TaxID=2498891 RepID=UPI00273B67BA|nr:uncharacterized protein LOC131686704 [Topomyia yanbarensis]